MDHRPIRQFTCLYPPPKVIKQLVQQNWQPLIKGRVETYFYGKGFFIFYFEFKEDKDLIFRNDPSFIGPKGLDMNKRSLDFDINLDIPSAIPVWVKLPHLPLLL